MNLSNLVEENSLYIPTGLSSLQRELYKILIKLHKDSLLRQLNDSNDQEESNKDVELNKVLINNLKLVNNHPFLLVDHYIPSKLLLMESNEHLISQSDKFNKFDKIIHSLLNLQNKFHRSLNLVVVGSSVKELDLIEAFLLERDLICSRSINNNNNNHNNNNNNNKGDAIELLNSSKNGEYVHHRRRKPIITNHKFKISLLTNNNLLNFHPGFNNNNHDTDLIISFDEELNEDDKNLEFFRKYNKIPLIKLIIINSFKHGKISTESSNDSSNEFSNSKELLFNSLKPLTLEIPTVNTEELLNNLINKSGNWNYSLSEFQKSNNNEIIESIQSIDLEFKSIETKSEPHQNGNKKVKLEDDESKEDNSDEELINSRNYQKRLTKLTIFKLDLIKKQLEINNKDLNVLKNDSTILSNHKDELKLKISNKFKDYKDLKDVKFFQISKLNEKLKFENEKLTEQINELKKPESESDGTLSESELSSKLDSLKLQSSELNSNLDELRVQYQHKTNEAVELSTHVSSLKSSNDTLLKNLTDTGIKLRNSKSEKIKNDHLKVINKLNSELKFLEAYQGKLEELVKERVNSLNVGRNGRVHRSTTPYI